MAEITSEQFDALIQVISDLGFAKPGYGALEGLGVALAGTSLASPVGEALNAIAANGGVDSTMISDSLDKIADGLFAVADAIKEHGAHHG